MKIVLATGLYPPDIGGPATYTKLFHDELIKRKHDVRVCTFGSVRTYPRIIRHIAFLFIILRQSHSADLIYAQDTMSVGWPSFCASILLRKLFIVRVPGDHVWEQAQQRFGVTESFDDFSYKLFNHHPYLGLLFVLRWIVVRFADAVVVPSEYFARVVSTWSKKAHIVTIYNGVEDITDRINREDARSKLGIESSDIVLLSVGRLVPWKGFTGLFPVIKKLSKQNISARLIIVGEGPLREMLEKESVSQGIQDRVLFAGGVSREILYMYLKSADVFVLNTHFESFSFQVVEAMQAGIPVVATAIGSLPELISSRKEGVLVQPDDTVGMLDAIKNILSDKSYRINIVENGQKKSTMFSIKRTADNFISLLSSFGV